MDLHNLSPWNWFKKERGNDSSTVPVVYREADSTYPVQRLRQGIDRMFDSLLRGNGEDLWPAEGAVALFNPQLDIKESADCYTIEVEVPGMERKDIDIQIQGDTLLISGEKKQLEETTEHNYHCIERSFGAFRRMLTLPQDVDVDEVAASYNSGMLNIGIKKNPNVKPTVRRVEINQRLH